MNLRRQSSYDIYFKVDKKRDKITFSLGKGGTYMANRVRAKSLDQSERQVMIYRDDRIFAKNPDVVLLPSGKMLCVFNETDYHWPTEFSRIKLLESTDYGKSWNNFRIIDEAYPSRGEERWVTPR
ncbi:hypothetical protein DRJ00_09315, partial [Candidatus Aerophobetes bacterium]